MTDNATTLRQGFAQAKAIIQADLMKRLGQLTSNMVSSMQAKMNVDVPGMTGNTMTSPAGATYANGIFEELFVDGKPIQNKLTKGDIFHAGRMRYDGDIQEADFKVPTPTTNRFQQQDNYDFLESQQSGANEFKATIMGGTEYLGHEQVTDNFAKCQLEIDKYFK